ncbi:signal-regulatory protein beta-2-like isoform 1-T1 [Tautogolabrus adspersus]
MKNTKPIFEAEFSSSRFDANISKNTSNLTILTTTQEDEGMYHCGVRDWPKITWSGTYVSLKGNSERRSNLTVVQWPTVSGPLRPGDLMTLQCSVLSDSDSKTCPGGHSVFWFRAGSHESRPDIIYTAGNRRDRCEESSASQKSCVYHFSKNVSSSDAGTYYCAVDTCGRLLFGDGTKVDVEGNIIRSFSLKENAVTVLLCAAFTLTLIVIAVLIHAIKTNNSASDGLGENCDVWRSGLLKNLKRDQVYSAVVFTSMKSKKGAKATEKERIYAAVKAFGLDQ